MLYLCPHATNACAQVSKKSLDNLLLSILPYKAPVLGAQWSEFAGTTRLRRNAFEAREVVEGLGGRVGKRERQRQRQSGFMRAK